MNITTASIDCSFGVKVLDFNVGVGIVRGVAHFQDGGIVFDFGSGICGIKLESRGSGGGVSVLSVFGGRGTVPVGLFCRGWDDITGGGGKSSGGVVVGEAGGGAGKIGQCNETVSIVPTCVSISYEPIGIVPIGVTIGDEI